MQPNLGLCLAFSTLLASAPLRADCPGPLPGQDPAAAEQFVVRIASYADVEVALSQIEALAPGVTLLDAIPSQRIYLLQPPIGVFDCELVEIIDNVLVNPDPLVPDPNRPLLSSELNFEGGAPEGQTGTIFIRTPPANGDIRYRQQYAFSHLGLVTAQTRSTGRGALVAIVDTGVDAAHPELAGRVLTGYNFVTQSEDTSDVGDGLDNDGDSAIDELAGHGTFLAGLVALAAPESRILPVTVLDSDGRSDQFRIAKGIYYAVERGADVINLSISSTWETELIIDAVKYARRSGVVVAAAAGNRNSNTPREYPASGNDIIGVAATDADDHKAAFSSYGFALAISAPGASDLLADQTVDPQRAIYSLVPGGDFASWEGTSVATAWVSAAAALIRAQHPEWSADESSVEDIEDTIFAAAAPIDALNPDYAGQLGVGRLDIGAAVAAGPMMPAPGDLNADGQIDLADLALLLPDFGGPHTPADLSGDGAVGIEDLATMLSRFGQ